MRLPNLSALRAFEAAVRHDNFSRAAAELCLTHGAISHQVRTLEEELGVQLFTRNGRQVTATPEAQRYAATVARCLAELADGAAELRPQQGLQRLSVTSIPSFAARWLAPRLRQFIEQHPEVEVILQVGQQLQDLAQEGIDIGIRFGRGKYPGLETERLSGEVLYPVASPRYRQGELPRCPSDLEQATLLRSEDPWTPWFQAAELCLPEPSGGVMFDDLSMQIRAAVDGDGVALVRHIVAMQEIASGHLVRLFDLAIPCADEYYLVIPPHAMQKPQVRAFRKWLKAEIARNQRQPAQSPYTDAWSAPPSASTKN
ncbi:MULTISPECIES: transcriptional regulator GcvA [unclassified Duganella]|uniref:transcriptional regulator GcvA n=1 Tax=unclassified Duganella TaxID=2636909 RepID=UPI0006F9F414|nr:MULTISPECIES: transcriptional regulator GcvA [unclassified Duganella]KQV46009.1 XRE family transcriptional regulator [Duganella sp. Root336D2]KRB81675.1 XRE family transcriptional regulator [Duganella sp. Root198D2]